MIRTIVTTLVFSSICSPAIAEKNLLQEGVWTGTMAFSDGTRRNADYDVAVSEDNEIEMRVEDEEQNKYVFKPVSVKNRKVSFLWDPENENSRCTLKMRKNTDYYQGECKVLNSLSVTLTMRPPEGSGEPEITQSENQSSGPGE